MLNIKAGREDLTLTKDDFMDEMTKNEYRKSLFTCSGIRLAASR